MNNQVSDKLSLFYWPIPLENKSVDFRYYRYPATINSTTDDVDWSENDLWVLKTVLKFHAVQYMNFGEDHSERLKWFHTYKKEAKQALQTLQKRSFHRVNLGFVGRAKTSTDVLSRDLRRYPNNL